MNRDSSGRRFTAIVIGSILFVNFGCVVAPLFSLRPEKEGASETRDSAVSTWVTVKAGRVSIDAYGLYDRRDLGELSLIVSNEEPSTAQIFSVEIVSSDASYPADAWEMDQESGFPLAMRPWAPLPLNPGQTAKCRIHWTDVGEFGEDIGGSGCDVVFGVKIGDATSQRRIHFKPIEKKR